MNRLDGMAPHQKAVAVALVREIGRTRTAAAWPQRQREVLERALEPHAAELAKALTAARGVPGRVAPCGLIRFDSTRGGRTDRGWFSPSSGKWNADFGAGEGVLDLAVYAWGTPAAHVTLEAASARMASLLGRAMPSSLGAK